MTDERLSQIKERYLNTSGNPWQLARDDPRMVLGPACYSTGMCAKADSGYYAYAAFARFDNKSDAEFIAHSRQDIPDLLAEVERLKGIIQFLREYLNDKGVSVIL